MKILQLVALKMEIGNIIPHIEALIFASDKPLTSMEITELTNNAFGFMEEKLTLKRASASRPSGEWNDDDYDVLSGGKVVGRILSGRHGCGRSRMAITRIAHQRMATKPIAQRP